jgi:hypothetical protein
MNVKKITVALASVSALAAISDANATTWIKNNVTGNGYSVYDVQVTTTGTGYIQLTGNPSTGCSEARLLSIDLNTAPGMAMYAMAVSAYSKGEGVSYAVGGCDASGYKILEGLRVA